MGHADLILADDWREALERAAEAEALEARRTGVVVALAAFRPQGPVGTAAVFARRPRDAAPRPPGGAEVLAFPAPAAAPARPVPGPVPVAG